VQRTVVIVDDHSAFRAAARALLQTEGFDVVGEAFDGASALEICARLRPDVVLLDIRLPGLDGFAVARILASSPGVDPAPTIVLISSRGEASYRERLEKCPARGYLAKRDLSGAALSALLAD
jgi:DNA-binding NarL/FixJ family response regulator